jgi:hypothetical protein
MVVLTLVAAWVVPAAALTTRDYVQGGLVACWDGVENAGRGVHAASTNQWIDVVSNVVAVLTTSVVIEANRMTFPSAAAYAAIASADGVRTFGKAGNGTIEVVVYTTGGGHAFQANSLCGGLALGRYSNNHLIAGRSGTLCAVFDWRYTTNTITIVYTSSQATQFFINGIVAATANDTYWNETSGECIIGNRQSKSSSLSGSVFCLRIYNRKLSLSEAAANYAVDYQRFVEGKTADGAVVVSGDPVALGEPTTGYGEIPVIEGTAVEFSLGGGTNIGGTTLYVSADGLTRGAFTKAIFTPQNGSAEEITALSFTRTMPKRSTLVWVFGGLGCNYRFAANDQMDFLIDGESAAVGDNWVSGQARVTVTAVPRAGYGFVSWPSGVPDALKYSAEVTLDLADGGRDLIVESRAVKTWYAAPAASGKGDGSSPENASGNAATVMNAAGDGDTVILFPGVHSLSATCWVSKRNVTVKGSTGDPRDVTLDRRHGDRVLVIAGEGSVVRDLTLARGNVAGRGSGAYFTAKASLVNCRVTDCYERQADGSGLVDGADNVGFTVKDCVFEGNRGAVALGGLFRETGRPWCAVRLSTPGTLVEGCVVSNNYLWGWRSTGSGFAFNMQAGRIADCEIAYNRIHTPVVFGSAASMAIYTQGGTVTNVAVHHNVYYGAKQANVVTCVMKDTTVTDLVEHDNGWEFETIPTPSVPRIDAASADALYAAVASAEPGSEIVLAPGVYTLTNHVLIDRPVTLRGATGRYGDVVLDGAGTYVVRLQTEGARLADVTLQNGPSLIYADFISAAAIFGGGTIEHCRVTGCDKTKGVFLRNLNGTVSRCLIDGNVLRDAASPGQGEWCGNGVYASYGPRSLMDRCVIQGNVATNVHQNNDRFSAGAHMVNGAMRSTLIMSNLIFYAASVTTGTTISPNQKTTGIFRWDGAVENCTVIDNFTVGVPQENVGAISATDLNYGKVCNTVLWNNGDRDGALIVNYHSYYGVGPRFVRCATTNAAAITRSIELKESPYTRDPRGRFTVAKTSPVLDKGDDMAWAADARDVYDKPRIYGAAIDIGAVEYRQIDGTTLFVR